MEMGAQWVDVLPRGSPRAHSRLLVAAGALSSKSLFSLETQGLICQLPHLVLVHPYTSRNLSLATHPDALQVYFDVRHGDEDLGRIVMGLYGKTVPKVGLPVPLLRRSAPC